MRNCMLPSDNGVHSTAFAMWYYAWYIKRMSLGHTHSLVLQKSKISGHEATGRKRAFPWMAHGVLGGNEASFCASSC